MPRKNTFAEQLAKGFVRSAVNQMGRNTGNAMSNNLYGNNHANPIKVVNDITPVGESVLPVQTAQDVFHIPVETDVKGFEAFLLGFVATIIPFGILWVFYTIIADFAKSIISIKLPATDYVKVSDRRYRDGYRLKTRNIYKVYSRLLNPSEKEVFRKRAFYRLAGLLAFFGVGWLLILTGVLTK